MNTIYAILHKDLRELPDAMWVILATQQETLDGD
jgi:hypothetical protein